jgi:hypothetical protein
MKKFSKVLEEIQNERFFKVDAQVQLIVPAENEGEAGYLSDSILSSIEYSSNYQLMNIDETDEKLDENMELYPGKQPAQGPTDLTNDEVIEKSWEAAFGDRTPTTQEKMEWYHGMRKEGFNGEQIFKVLKNRF